MATRSKQGLTDNITTDLADNNAGNISASDVRQNMLDIVDSIIPIIETEEPINFKNDVTLGPSENGDPVYLHVSSGIFFQDGLQTERYPGLGDIPHSGLAGRDLCDAHPQYFVTDPSSCGDEGVPIREVKGNWSNADWISSSGVSNRGIKFTQDTDQNEIVNLSSNTSMKFGSDNSSLSTAKGSALAWLNFGASGVDETVTVAAAHEVDAIERWKANPSDSASEGKFQINFKPGTFANANFVAVGSSSARGDSDEAGEFDRHTVGLVERGGQGTVLSPHYVTFFVLNEQGNYVDASINDLVIYGLASGVSVGTDISSVTLPTPE